MNPRIEFEERYFLLQIWVHQNTRIIGNFSQKYTSHEIPKFLPEMLYKDNPLLKIVNFELVLQSGCRDCRKNTFKLKFGKNNFQIICYSAIFKQFRSKKSQISTFFQKTLNRPKCVPKCHPRCLKCSAGPLKVFWTLQVHHTWSR